MRRKTAKKFSKLIRTNGYRVKWLEVLHDFYRIPVPFPLCEIKIWDMVRKRGVSVGKGYGEVWYVAYYYPSGTVEYFSLHPSGRYYRVEYEDSDYWGGRLERLEKCLKVLSMLGFRYECFGDTIHVFHMPDYSLN